ncbi:hypothetical protein, partial [Rurimicrobium arvi]|uniref:hypothetical protein n=1 Tax=Rurimicrobium arvi TaxID=2049916 RepID=UPI0031DDAC8E
MKIALKNIFRGLLYLLPVMLAFQSKASHLAAADISVDYVPTAASPYTYKITLNVYKACELGAIDLSKTETLNWESISKCLPGDSRDMGTPQIDTLDQLCDTFKKINSCRTLDATSVALRPAFVRHRWQLVVTLPGPCSDWVFWWHEGARNSAIQNLQGPSGYDLFVDAMINITKKARVNTPRYTLDPIPYFCRGNKVSFPNAPQDPDLDSMVSVNQQPRGNSATLIPYVYIPYACPPPAPATAYCYSLTDPIASDPSYPYYFDPSTGTATFQPTINGKFVLAFKTYDYDRQTGDLMGFTTRDVQVAVINCDAPPPTTDTTPSNIAG